MSLDMLLKAFYPSDRSPALGFNFRKSIKGTEKTEVLAVVEKRKALLAPVTIPPFHYWCLI